MVAREFLWGPCDGETRLAPEGALVCDTEYGRYVLEQTRWGAMFVWKGEERP